jgi:hypothetical protein
MFCHIVRVAPAFWLHVQDLADLSFTPLPLLKVSRVLVRLDNVAWLSDQTHGELVYRPFAVPGKQFNFSSARTKSELFLRFVLESTVQR